MLSLHLYLLEGFPYRSEKPSFPVVAELVSDQHVELSTCIEVRELTLTAALSGPDDFFGVLRIPLPKLGPVFELLPHRSHFKTYDVFEFDENADGFTPGEYVLRLTLKVHRLVDGKFQSEKLTSEKIISVI